MNKLFLSAALFVIFGAAVFAQTNDFTYQGTLNLTGIPANGNFDFEFRLFDAENGGAQVGSTATRSGVTVTNGAFNVSLSFAGAFPGADRWMEISVRQTGSGGYQQLLPRVKVNSSPYSIKSQSAETAANATTATTATNSLNLGGVAANQYVQTTDPRMTDARPPTAGSTSYIQNQNSGEQPQSNFHITGTGRAFSFRAWNYKNASGETILSAGSAGTSVGVGAGWAGGWNSTYVGFEAGYIDEWGENNTLIGWKAGRLSNAGVQNTFVGSFAGYSTAQFGANNNAFFGFEAGYSNTTTNNSFFGALYGRANTTGLNNAFFGVESGTANTTGQVNSFFGAAAGKANTVGTDNSFFGTAAGFGNTTGNENTFLGRSAGRVVTSGSRNTFVGFEAGNAATLGLNNTALGAGSDVSSGSITYATAIGAGAIANQSNSVFLGRPAGEDTVRVSGPLSVSGGIIVNNLGGTNTNTHLCRNSANVIAGCLTNFAESSEIESLKKDIGDQKAAILQQQKTIEKQQSMIEALTQLLCSANPTAAVCTARQQ